MSAKIFSSNLLASAVFIAVVLLGTALWISLPTSGPGIVFVAATVWLGVGFLTADCLLTEQEVRGFGGFIRAMILGLPIIVIGMVIYHTKPRKENRF
jgi:hypothetical protein